MIISEESWQSTVIELLRTYGYTVCEFRKSRRKIRRTDLEYTGDPTIDVYRSAFGADGVGFPDLVAVRPPRVLFCENKSSSGKLSNPQKQWRILLEHCPGVEYWLVSPEDFERIEKEWR